MGLNKVFYCQKPSYFPEIYLCLIRLSYRHSHLPNLFVLIIFRTLIQSSVEQSQRSVEISTCNLSVINFKKTHNLDGSTAEPMYSLVILVSISRYPVLTAFNKLNTTWSTLQATTLGRKCDILRWFHCGVDGRVDIWSHDFQNFWDGQITKFSQLWDCYQINTWFTSVKAVKQGLPFDLSCIILFDGKCTALLRHNKAAFTQSNPT